MTLSYPMWLLIGCQNHIAEEYADRKAVILQSPSALSDNWAKNRSICPNLLKPQGKALFQALKESGK